MSEKYVSLLESMSDLSQAFLDVWRAWEQLSYEEEVALECVCPDYPFDSSFDEKALQVGTWVEITREKILQILKEDKEQVKDF